VRLFRIYEGTTQIQQLVIARAMIVTPGIGGRCASTRSRGAGSPSVRTTRRSARRPPWSPGATSASRIDACAKDARAGRRAAGRPRDDRRRELDAADRALFATSAIDACAIVANPRLSPRELDTMREHATPRRVLFATGVAAEVDEHARRIGASDLGTRISRCRRSTRRGADARDADDTSQLAAIVYTTGTSGRPKGVMLTHANLLFVAETVRDAARHRPGRPRVRRAADLPRLRARLDAARQLRRRRALHVVARFDAQRALGMLAHDGLTIFQGVPAMYARMLERLPDGARAEAPALRYLYAGGSILDPSSRPRSRALRLPASQRLRADRVLADRVADAASAIRATTRRSAADPRVELHVEPSGELWVRGPNVMKGYYRDPAATAEAITPDGWLKTGDLARIGDDGALFIVGRQKELIIRSGLNVHPVEVETVLNTHPAVAQSVVVGRMVGDGNEEVVAFVEPVRGRTVAPDELAAHAAAQLAPYKRPSRIVVMDALPASPTGKVLRGRLKQLAQSS
jgi:acyl-CoA synthetase (AMP-forming)/AMP-acid ligase II